jgi:hypothetical protein
MYGEKKLFGLAVILAILGGGLLWHGEVSGAPPKCDNNATVPCSCVQTGANTVCHDFNQPVVLIWCSPNGNRPCVAAQNVNCPGNGKDGAGTCAGGFVPGNNPCANTPLTTC